jgi:membrane-bound lytic murein transglycosylase MltF
MKIAYIALIGLILVAYCIADAKPLTEEQVTRLATSVSKQTGVEADLLIAIAKVESSLNPKAVGRSHGEVGLMQLHPRYFPKTSATIEVQAQRLKSHKSLLITKR